MHPWHWLLLSTLSNTLTTIVVGDSDKQSVNYMRFPYSQFSASCRNTQRCPSNQSFVKKGSSDVVSVPPHTSAHRPHTLPYEARQKSPSNFSSREMTLSLTTPSSPPPIRQLKPKQKLTSASSNRVAEAREESTAFGFGRHPTASEVVRLAEWYAALQSVTVAQLLVVDVSGFLSQPGQAFSTSGSLLLSERWVPSASARCSTRLFSKFVCNGLPGPHLLEALRATTLKIVVITANFEYLNKVQFLQNVRSKVLLHIVLTERLSHKFVEEVPVLRWITTNVFNPRFECWRAFDNTVALYSGKVMRRCLSRPPVCTVAGFSYVIRQVGLINSMHPTLMVKYECNGSADVYAEWPAEGGDCNDTSAHPYLTYTAEQRSIISEKELYCHSLLAVYKAGFESFLTPFLPEVWIVFALSLGIVSIVLAQVERCSLAQVVWEASLGIIASVPSKLPSHRHASGLTLSGLLLFTNFFMSQFYSNDVMTKFMNPGKPRDPKEFFQCRFSLYCQDERKRLNVLFAGDALCGLSTGDAAAITHPLHYASYDRSRLKNRANEHVCSSVFLFSVKAKVLFNTDGKAHGLAPTVTQRSYVMDRFRETGIIGKSFGLELVRSKSPVRAGAIKAASRAYDLQFRLVSIVDKTQNRFYLNDTIAHVNWANFSGIISPLKFWAVLLLVVLLVECLSGTSNNVFAYKGALARALYRGAMKYFVRLNLARY